MIVRLNGVDIEMKGVDIQPMNIELMSVKDLAERLIRLKSMIKDGFAGTAYNEARLLDDELERMNTGLRLSFSSDVSEYVVYLKEEV